MLELDHLGDTSATEDVFAVGDHRARHRFDADRTVFLALNDESERLLQKRAVLGVEFDDIVLLEELQQVSDALFA
jgi:hypothetical protein